MVTLPPDRPAIMGVLNVTPDSFSDGGRYLDATRAVARGLEMVQEGADIVDVGGESTRPGSEGVPADEELARVLPVVQGLVRHRVAVSIDTSKVEVARPCLLAGALVVNDVTGAREAGMPDLCAEFGCTVCVMHMQGEPRTMQANPGYGDVVAEVKEYLLGRAEALERAGVVSDRIWIDPGIGFGKTVAHNLALLRYIDELVATPYPVLVGVSRKSFIGRVLGNEDPLPTDRRLEGSLAVQVWAQAAGVRILRTHDVLESRKAATMLAELLRARR